MNRKRESVPARVMNAIALVLISICVSVMVGPVVSAATATLLERFSGTSVFSHGRAGGTFLTDFFLREGIMLIFAIPATAFTFLVWLPLWLSRGHHRFFERKRLAVPVGATAALLAWFGWLGYWYFIRGNPDLVPGRHSPDPRTWPDSVLIGSAVGSAAAGALVGLLTTFFLSKTSQGKVLMEIPPRVTVVADGRKEKAPPVPPVATSKKAPARVARGKPKKKPSWTDWADTRQPPE